MPSSDYAATGSGALKLKGGAGVDRKKKRKKKPPTRDELESSITAKDKTTNKKHDAPDHHNDDTRMKEDDSAKELADYKTKGGKTEAELRFEEQRRRRLNERLKREGVKTHKERVEELNRHLSTLSEHHDMPRIGPG